MYAKVLHQIHIHLPLHGQSLGRSPIRLPELRYNQIVVWHHGLTGLVRGKPRPGEDPRQLGKSNNERMTLSQQLTMFTVQTCSRIPLLYPLLHGGSRECCTSSCT
jgi:hypothetical protein